MEAALPILMTLFSILIPAKSWFAPNQPLDVKNDSKEVVTLVLTTFTGQAIEAGGATKLEPGKDVDLKAVFPQVATPGTYLLYAVPEGKSLPEFIGTPLVIGVRQDKREGAPSGPVVTKVEPLRYAVATTGKGKMTIIFYFDVAPNTGASFLSLADGGYFDGLTFHRVVPEFVIQGGDPRGDGTGGPGYSLPPEFNDRPHTAGTLSMARQGDPSEAPGVPPRYEFAASAGSQFFVCLDYERTKQLDGRYTVFGKVVEGMDTVRAIADTKLADPATGKPEQPQVIEKIEVIPVTPGKNPYEKLDVEEAK
ncbi:MAG TPA: peptidylprolyl isomerase [Tepidisphaeraceae bacterium]|jgi:peptidyl-prolyl cis-trans isomerase B (cyclophilin B)|nr:peptidylprolyl isomerase [Tepidisphaeraceae bacterium]